MNEHIEKRIYEMGIPKHIKGYRYLIEAIETAVNNADNPTLTAKEIYCAIAEKYETTPSRVERAIRHTMEIALDKDKFGL